MNYYIGDLHFGHANAISFDNRPFASVEEMNEALIHGMRHADCWETMAALGIPAGHKEVEGFIDDKNRFLDRCDAFSHALECGQLPATVRIHKAEQRENQLYSEDLY